MQITFHTSTVPQMTEWLRDRSRGNADEARLREILRGADYAVEFARYGEKGLPVCNISFEEAVDFFLHFDEKEFENPRLAYKKQGFLAFYHSLDKSGAQLSAFDSLTADDAATVEHFLSQALPEEVLSQLGDVTILITVSIGNSMGWPYGSYIHFDAANFPLLGDRETFLHVVAHELHHMLFGCLVPEHLTAQELFFVRFAFEGLAMHYMNNAGTMHKPPKYPGRAFGVDAGDWAFFGRQFDNLFSAVKRDGESLRDGTEEDVSRILAEKYEIFTMTSLADGEVRTLAQYPTYYMGCFLWGLIDRELGRDAVLRALAHPVEFVGTFNRASERAGLEYRL